MKFPQSQSSDVEIKIVTSSGQTQVEKYSQYDLEEWCETLCEAAEIEADPAKMAALKPMLDIKSKSFKSIDDLRKFASKQIGRDQPYQSGSAIEGDEMMNKPDDSPVETIEV